MKRVLALLLTVVITLTGCAQQVPSTGDTAQNTVEQTTEANIENNSELATKETDEAVVEPDAESKSDESEETASVDTEKTESVPDFTGLNDPELLQYIEDDIYSDLESQFASEDYRIENVTAVYVSKEYLEEVAFNSQSNIFFGYTLDELDEQFQGTRYVFTLGENGETTVQPFEEYDDTYEKVIRNVAIGTGVILICVTVSVVTGGLGAAPVSMIFAASAKTATTMALSTGVISGVAEGVITGIQTKDFDKALKAGALKGSEGFMWGSITGALVGGVSEANALRNARKAAEAAENVAKATPDIPTPEEAEQLAAEFYKVSESEQQVSYLAGKEVDQFTQGATRPDLIRNVDGHIEAIEVKRYDLNNQNSVNRLYSELERQVTARVENLPPGSTQRICLNTQGREISEEVITEVTENIQMRLADIYPNIPIDVMR